jgi:hypothetical protein
VKKVERPLKAGGNVPSVPPFFLFYFVPYIGENRPRQALPAPGCQYPSESRVGTWRPRLGQTGPETGPTLGGSGQHSSKT